jgi:hypothetical protein
MWSLLSRSRLLLLFLALWPSTHLRAHESGVLNSAAYKQLIPFGGELVESLERLLLSMMRDTRRLRQPLLQAEGQARGMIGKQLFGDTFGGPPVPSLAELDRQIGELFWGLEGEDLFKVHLDADGKATLTRAPTSLTGLEGVSRAVPLVVRNESPVPTVVFSAWEGLEKAPSGRHEFGVPAGATRGFLLDLEGAPGSFEAALDLVVGDRKLQQRLRLGIRRAGRLQVSLRNRNGDGVAARCYLTDSDGFSRAPIGALERLTLITGEPYFYADGGFSVSLPPGPATLEVVQGLETSPLKRIIPIVAGETSHLELEVEPAWSLAAEGWYSGDVHIHANYIGGETMTPADILLQTRAEGLNVANLMVANSVGTWVHDERFFQGRPHDLSDSRHILYWNEEMRNFRLYGHMALLNLKRLVQPLYTGWKGSLYPDDYPANYSQARAAQQQGGAVSYVHPGRTDPSKFGARAYELPVDLALGAVDAMDILSNSDEIASMELWYRLLNCGFRCAVSAGTDTFVNLKKHFILGASRVYVQSGAELDYASWIKAYKEGRSFATNGPLLRLEVEGKGPGAELYFPSSPVTLSVEARSHSLVPVDRLEIIVNGEVVRSLPATDAGDLRLEAEVQLSRSSWIAARVLGPASRWVPNDAQAFAHTSPVYCYLAGQPIRSPGDARFFMSWIDDLSRKVDRHGVFSKAQQKKEVLELFRRAQQVYARQVTESQVGAESETGN